MSVFAKNLRNLLLQPPMRGKRILAVDPGFRTGCKLAVLDECGWNRSEAARRLGMTRNTLAARIRTLGLDRGA